MNRFLIMAITLGMLVGCAVPKYTPPTSGKTATISFHVPSTVPNRVGVYAFDSRQCDGKTSIGTIWPEDNGVTSFYKAFGPVPSTIETPIKADREFIATLAFATGGSMYNISCNNTIAISPSEGGKYNATFEFDFLKGYCATIVTKWNDTLGKAETLISSTKPPTKCDP
jgi:hypothetical protein